MTFLLKTPQTHSLGKKGSELRESEGDVKTGILEIEGDENGCSYTASFPKKQL